MLESMRFTYNGISSDDLGVFMINPNNGLYEETFLPSRKINTTKVYGRNNPYFKGVENEPLSFSLSIFIEEWRERKNLREIARWLFQDYYKPLFFESNPERIFYAIFEGSSSLIHNGCKDGYITLNVTCNSPFTYSPIKPYNFRVIDGKVNNKEYVELLNDGDLKIRPKLKITQYGTDDIKIKNNTNGQEFILKAWNEITGKGVIIGEVVEVDCANEVIISSFETIEHKYLYDSHNDIWLDFDELSEIKLTFTGNFDVELTLERVYLAEDNPIYTD